MFSKSKNIAIEFHSFSGVLELFKLLDKDQHGIVHLSLAEVSDLSFDELLADSTLKVLDSAGAEWCLFLLTCPISMRVQHMFFDGQCKEERHCQTVFQHFY